MHNSFKNTLNSMRTQVSASHAQSVKFSKCYPNVLLLTLNKNMYRLINAPKILSIFSGNTPNKGTKYKYNTLVHRKENGIRNER